MKTGIKSKKETLKELKQLLGNDTVWSAEGSHAFGFGIDDIAKRYGAIDRAPAAYRHQFDFDIGKRLEDELKENGFIVINIWVGTWVHGWIHYVVKKPI